jgi:protein-disulfide isomerase
MLTPPVNAKDHVLGSNQALVTVVEYGDYQCPFCGRAHPIVEETLRRLGHDVRFVYRHFPLARVHPRSVPAAEAAEAAGAQARFWPMHDMLFENQDALEDDDLADYAEALGLDMQRFIVDLQTGAHRDKVSHDFRSGVRSGVNGTPTFFIDDERFDGAWEDGGLTLALAAAIKAKKQPRDTLRP